MTSLSLSHQAIELVSSSARCCSNDLLATTSILTVAFGVVGIAAHERRRDADHQCRRACCRTACGVVDFIASRKSIAAGQDLVLDLDHAHGFVGDVLAVGRDDGDRGADFEDLLVEQTTIGRAAAELDVLVHVGQVAAVQDRAHARELLGFADVDALDARMRMRAAQRARVQRARHRHVLGVLAEPGDDAQALHARRPSCR